MSLKSWGITFSLKKIPILTETTRVAFKNDAHIVDLDVQNMYFPRKSGLPRLSLLKNGGKKAAISAVNCKIQSCRGNPMQNFSSMWRTEEQMTVKITEGLGKNDNITEGVREEMVGYRDAPSRLIKCNGSGRKASSITKTQFCPTVFSKVHCHQFFYSIWIGHGIIGQAV